jgi:hypothetical protein
MKRALTLHAGSFTNPEATPWLRWLIVGLSPGGLGTIPGPLCVGALVGKVTLGQVLPGYFWFSLSL